MNKIHSNQNIKIVIETVVFTFIGMIFVSGIMSLLRENGVVWLSNNEINNILLELTILAIQLIILRRYYKNSVIMELGLRRKDMRWLRIAIIFMVGTLLVIVSYVILGKANIIYFKETGFQLESNSETLKFLLVRFIQMLTVGIAEEACFRGMIANHLYKFGGRTVAILGSTIIFTIFHCMVWQCVTQITDIFVLGLTLGILYMKTRSLYDVIAFHFAIDFVTNIFGIEEGPGLIILSFGNGYSEADVTKYLFGIMTILGGVICLVLGLMKDRK